MEIKVRATLQSEMASNKGLNPVVQFTDLSRISKRQNSFANITQVKFCAEQGKSLFMCPPRKSGVGWGDRGIKNFIGPGSFHFFSFQKKTEEKKRTKKGGKRNKPLPAERRPSFSHYCGSLAVV